MELLVTLAVLSILASAALPFAEVTVRRDKELEFKRALRQIRTAIDELHEDWKTGRVPKIAEGISADGYPRTLQVLVEGVKGGDAKGGHRRYLRRIPPDPLAKPGLPADEQWLLRSYQDDVEALTWGGQDVYDVRSASTRRAIDGSYYAKW